MHYSTTTVKKPIRKNTEQSLFFPTVGKMEVIIIIIIFNIFKHFSKI